MTPEVSSQLNQHWQRPDGWFSHLPAEGTQQRWRVHAPAAGESLFLRVAYSVPD